MEKTKHCDECAYFNYDLVPGKPLCEKGHKPRWYGQKAVYDTDWGYKRRCDDFEKAR